ncbi:hypothetical protein QFC22_004349 [Naganishia vaughanmartiniae]|uniref:Uncharacterized protein n=1 Tax=Naganishia vaughanmartiniae TaxID=1424756 RepID=A0ACC2X252_9TREE|nr:hypothetical protein QFC22_004349 [Naganishia vaughanmartiniae]
MSADNLPPSTTSVQTSAPAVASENTKKDKVSESTSGNSGTAEATPSSKDTGKPSSAKRPPTQRSASSRSGSGGPKARPQKKKESSSTAVTQQDKEKPSTDTVDIKATTPSRPRSRGAGGHPQVAKQPGDNAQGQKPSQVQPQRRNNNNNNKTAKSAESESGSIAQSKSTGDGKGKNKQASSKAENAKATSQTQAGGKNRQSNRKSNLSAAKPEKLSAGSTTGPGSVSASGKSSEVLASPLDSPTTPSKSPLESINPGAANQNISLLGPEQGELRTPRRASSFGTTILQDGNRIQAIASPPVDAYTAARQGAKKKEKELGNVESLQKMITDLKSLPPAPLSASSGSAHNSDRRSSATNFRPQAMSIPTHADAKLKPDAQPFTPSSPVNPLLSPTSGVGLTESSILKNRSSFTQNNPPQANSAQSIGNFDVLLRQQEEAKLALDQQLALQRLQAQAAAASSNRQGSHRSSGSIGSVNPGASGSLPPRFQRSSVRNQPLYEESALDDENEITYNSQGMPQLAPAFNIESSAGGQGGKHNRARSISGQKEGVLNESFRMPQLAGSGSPAGDGHMSSHDRNSMGINAGMLASIAARAHQRTGSELNPLMAEQLQIQRQIELLQDQQRLLLQQQSINQPSGLSNLGNLLRNNGGGNNNDFSRDLQEQYVQALAAQQMQIQAQATALAQAQAQQTAFLNQQMQQQQQLQHRQSQSSLNDFTMPSFNGSNNPNNGGRTAGNHLHRMSSASNDIGNNPSRNSRQGSDASLALPPIPAGGNNQHRRRNSAQTHRPANSIIGSFGGFVSDFDDMPPLPGQGGHNRTGSRSAADNWRSANNNQVTSQAGMDLAQAQAQLQLLTNFRSSQGVGGHHKMASFSFPNLLPNLHVAQTLGPSSQSLVQQQQAFQMQLQQSSGPGPQRKSLFAPYLPHGSLPALLAAGKLVVGSLRVNKRNRSDAYVATDVLDADIYICGSKDRNRALEGDIVAVELLDVDEVWNAKKEKEEKKRKKEENSAYDMGISKAASRKNDKKKDDVEVEGQGMVLFEEEEVTDEQKPTYAGHVVAVVERMTGQLFSGQLGVLRPSSAATKEKQEAERKERDGNDRGDNERHRPQEQRPKIVWFKPTDKRVPLIAIPTEQAPGNFLDEPDAYADKLFVATIKRWPITSLHPFGSLVEELGTIGDLETETAALLKDCNFPTEDFPESVLRCLPPTPWEIPEREYATRRDMREERVFTIDPETAKDLDDALSIKTLDDGTYEVGVHIADVSYFVKPNTALDREARKRATTVYLVQRAVPMLPALLCEQLCSLVPGVERLTFSCFFIIDSDGNVLKKQFERSVIKSCVKLAYDDAQRVIEGDAIGDVKTVSEPHQVSEVEKDILLLHTLAKKLRARRFENGALKIDNVKLSFNLDDEGRPIDCGAYVQREANALIEEYMLLGNMAAAQTIANGLPEQALLRRHEPPIARRMEAFVERAKRLGFDFDGISSSDIQAAFDKVGEYSDKLCLQILSTRAMNRAKYFCTGMLDIAKYSHYALNAPVYTHFTSPIRRYADVLVHRMLDACITTETPESKFLMDRDQVAKCAQHCNSKKDAAKIAQEQSAHLHLCYLIHDLTQRFGAVIRTARVVGVLDSAFDVVVPEFGIEKRVHADKMPLANHVYDEHSRTLSLYWTERDVLDFLAENSDDEHLKRVINTNQRAKSAQPASESAANPDEEVGKASAEKYKGKQERKSATMNIKDLEFEGLRQTEGLENHKIQTIKELQSVPIIVSADISKSPPVLIVYAVNPYANH